MRSGSSCSPGAYLTWIGTVTAAECVVAVALGALGTGVLRTLAPEPDYRPAASWLRWLPTLAAGAVRETLALAVPRKGRTGTWCAVPLPRPGRAARTLTVHALASERTAIEQRVSA